MDGSEGRFRKDWEKNFDGRGGQIFAVAELSL